MNQLVKVAAAIALALGASAVFAHAKLENSIPANGATVTSAPNELRLRYSEPVEQAMSSVKVMAADGSPVASEKAEVAKNDDKTLVVKLPALSAGGYRVEWSTMGHDGHHTKGNINFTVK